MNAYIMIIKQYTPYAYIKFALYVLYAKFILEIKLQKNQKLKEQVR